MDISYKVIFLGQFRAGVNQEECLHRFMEIVHHNEEQASILLGVDGTVVVQTTHSKKDAFSMSKKLKKIGLICEVRPFVETHENATISMKDSLRCTPAVEFGAVGFEWFRDGFRFVRESLLVWIIFFVVLSILYFLYNLAHVTLASTVIAYVVAPILGAFFTTGFIYGVADQCRGSELSTDYIFSGFELGPRKLLVLAVLIWPLITPFEMILGDSLATILSIVSLKVVWGGLIVFLPHLMILGEVNCIKGVKSSIVGMGKNLIPLIMFLSLFIIFGGVLFALEKGLLMSLSQLVSGTTIYILNTALLIFISIILGAIGISSITIAYIDIFHSRDVK